ncbi:MAG: DNA-processing protein DprA [Candidatus Obscuribacterales bacterium]|nr:DNA-processing protein DprA [Candidatus Obscuribacterales bacterium]
MKVNALLDWCDQSGRSVSDVVREPELLKSRLTDDQLASIDSSTAVIEEELTSEEVQLLGGLDSDYPPLLRKGMRRKAPPLLYCRGNTELLSKTSIGFCGSRKASEKGIATARDCAEQLAEKDIVVISGYAAGVDITTHTAALRAGGATIIVLPEGILHFRIKSEIKDNWDWDRVLVVSHFEPRLPWSVRNAMARNSIICGLSKAMILIEAGTTGGSIAAGRTCLEMGRPLFAPVYEGMPESAAGNRILLNQGAHPLLKNRHTKRAAIEKVTKLIEMPDSDKEGAKQISLFA